MAGDTKLFQEALKRGSAHAWNEQWEKAADEYRRALREFPEDVSARTYLAMSLYKSGAYPEALELYQALLETQPANLTMLQRVAELQETVGDNHAAAISYGRLADAHTHRGASKEAFKAWQKLVALTPGNPLLWNSLIQVAVQVGAVIEVIPGYLGLARDLALQSRFQEAIQVAERAQTLDPDSPLVLPMLAAIRKGIEYSFRAASFGEEVYPEDLMRYIPSVEVLQSRLQTSSPLMMPLDTPVVEAPMAGPRDSAGGETLMDSLGGAASAAKQMFEVLFRPTSESMDHGVTIDSVRDRLARLGNVVEVQPRVEGRGGIVFVIMLASSYDEGFIRRTIEQSLRPADFRPEASPGSSQPQPQGLEVRHVAAPSQTLNLPVAEPDSADAEAAPEPTVSVSPTEEAEALPTPEPDLVEESVDGLSLDEAPVIEVEPDQEPMPVFEALQEPETVDQPAAIVAPEPTADEPALETGVEAEAAQVESPADGDAELPVDSAGLELSLPDITQEEAGAPETEEETAGAEAAATPEELLEGHPANGHLAMTPEDLLSIEIPEEASPPEVEVVETTDDETVAAGLGAETPQEEVQAVEQAEAENEPVAAAEAGAAAEPQDVLDQLMQRADTARSLGKLDEAIALYEEAVAANLAGAEQLVELGELHEAMGGAARAARAFAHALDLSPDLPQAMLGLARVDLSEHRLDDAEAQARKALQSSVPEYPEAGARAVDLLLEILRERAAYGDLGGSAEGLAWLQSKEVVERAPGGGIERMVAASRELLGQSVAEHLDEIVALPRYLRGEVTTTLWKAEKMVDEGKLRSAADEMFRIVSSHPEFLPAQSLLARVLVAQGRTDESARRSRRLLELYELRGRADSGLEVILWMTESGLATESDKRRLAVLLRGRGRVSEADEVEAKIEAEQRAEAERRAAEEAARRAAQEALERAAEEAARRAEEEAVRKAAQDAARRAAAEEAVKRTLEELANQAAEEEAHALDAKATPMHSGSDGALAETEELSAVGPAEPAKEPEVLPAAEPELPKEEVKPKRGGLRGMFGALRGVVKKEAEEKSSEPLAPAAETTGVTGHDALLRLAESQFAFGDAKGAAVLIRSALQDERIAADVPTKVALLRALQVTSPSEDDLRDTLREILENLGLPGELVD